MTNFIYIATSLDGFIARTDGSLDWLTNINNPENIDFGYAEFLSKIDAVVMGRKTFEFVEKITPWPYQKPVYVLSKSRTSTDIQAKVIFINQSPKEIISMLNSKGFNNLYIDGGKTIQGFLKDNLIDELIITRIPILLGSGIPLFENINVEIKLTHIETITYQNGLIKSTYQKR